MYVVDCFELGKISLQQQLQWQPRVPPRHFQFVLYSAGDQKHSCSHLFFQWSSNNHCHRVYILQKNIGIIVQRSYLFSQWSSNNHYNNRTRFTTYNKQLNYCSKTETKKRLLSSVLSVRVEVGVSLLLTPTGADKRGRLVLQGGIGPCPQKIFEIRKLGKIVSSDLKENINTQAFIIFIRKKVFKSTVQGSLLS